MDKVGKSPCFSTGSELYLISGAAVFVSCIFYPICEYLVQGVKCMIAGSHKHSRANPAAWSGWPYLIVLLISFFAGACVGGMLAFFHSPDSGLSDYLREYCAALSQGEIRPSFLYVLWDCVRWPLSAALLGFTALGVIGIPALFAARGFLLSFSTTTFCLLLGRSGIAVAAVLFSVTIFLVLPIMFVLGCDWLYASCLRLPNAVPSAGKRYRIESALICLGALIVSVALQWTLIPVVLPAVCSRLVF